MWLRRLVGFVLVITLIGMNVVVVVGLFKAPKKIITTGGVALNVHVPTVTLESDPPSLAAGNAGALKWSTTGNPTDCEATGTWTGKKTPFGAESTGRLKTPGNFTFTLSCTNAAGVGEAIATVAVGAASAPTPIATTTTNSSQQSQGSTYCGGRVPCYGPNDVSKHASAGNCWGYNKDRVINISGFDAAYHQIISGISSIEISDVCGKDLGPALNNQVPAGGQAARDHTPNTKNNSDRNEIPYFIGYYDGGKP